ncbi:Methyl-CpG-binding domain-containing protein 8 [Linum perenne]
MDAISAVVNPLSSLVSDDQLLTHLNAESLPLIDLRVLSQSELLSLSFCSSTFSSVQSLHSDIDLSTPRIDRSVFNESAGSRKQTFSRLRLAPRGSISHLASATASTATPLYRQISEVPLLDETRQIVSRLKSLFGVVDFGCGQIGEEDNLVSVPIQFDGTMSSSSNKTWALPVSRMDTTISSCSPDIEQPVLLLAGSVNSGGKKLRRGRPRKTQANAYGNCNKTINENGAILMPYRATETNRHQENMRIMNVNAKADELAALEKVDDPYGDRIRNSTAGMRTKEEVLDFLQGIQGQWTSSRRKKKIVDASAFGDLLPTGWKLLIRVTRRAGNAWLDCASYISPNGQQFVSFKEVASYIHSASGLQDASLSNLCSDNGNVLVTSQDSAEGDMCKDDVNGHEHPSTWAVSWNPIKQNKDDNTLETRSPDKSLIQKSFKCHKCIMAFNHQDELLQHLLTSHHGTRKRSRCGTPMNEEAIIKDGKYECQFCDKSYDERHRFHGHLGNHIKDYLKRMEGSLATGVVLPAVSVVSSSSATNITAIPAWGGGHFEGVNSLRSVGTDMENRVSNADPKQETRHGDTFVASNANDSLEKFNKQGQIYSTCPGEVARTNGRHEIVHKEVVSQDTSFATPVEQDSQLKNKKQNGSSEISALVTERMIGCQIVEDRNICSTKETSKIDSVDRVKEVLSSGCAQGCRKKDCVITANNRAEQISECCLDGFVNSPDTNPVNGERSHSCGGVESQSQHVEETASNGQSVRLVDNNAGGNTNVGRYLELEEKTADDGFRLAQSRMEKSRNSENDMVNVSGVKGEEWSESDKMQPSGYAEAERSYSSLSYALEGDANLKLTLDGNNKDR